MRRTYQYSDAVQPVPAARIGFGFVRSTPDARLCTVPHLYCFVLRWFCIARWKGFWEKPVKERAQGISSHVLLIHRNWVSITRVPRNAPSGWSTFSRHVNVLLQLTYPYKSEGHVS